MPTSSAATAFIGRQAERHEARGLLDRSRVLTLIGPGGSGKTRLALALAHELSEDLPDRSYIVGLAACHDPALVAETVAVELGLTPSRSGIAAADLAQYLGPEPALLVLDNCEHLVTEAAALVATLVRACTGLRVIATSRTPLNVVAEAVLGVGPLPAADAVALFCDRAALTLPGFTLDDQNRSIVESIAATLDGIPLAVELAAARLRTLSPPVLLERLSDPFDVLGKGPRDVAVRHRTLEASIDWSYQLCTDDEQALWRHLSVFAGGFELAAVEHLHGSREPGAPAILELVDALVDQSVLDRDPDQPTRYRMLETIRHFGARRLEADGGTEVWRQRHLRWAVALADDFAAGWFGPDQVRRMDRMRAEHANLRVALDQALLSDPEAALRLCCRLEVYWVCSGRFAEGGLWNQRARGLGTGPGHLRARVNALSACGMVMADADSDVEALLLEADHFLLEDPDDGAHGMVQYARGMAAADRDPAGALVAVEQSVAAMVRAGEVYGTNQSRYYQAFLLIVTGQLAAATAVAEQIRAESELHGEVRTGAYALYLLGLTAASAGDLDTADRQVQEALDRVGRVGDHLGIAIVLEMHSWLVSVRGDAARAALLVGAADAVWRAMGMRAERVPLIAAMIESGVLAHRVRAEVDHPTEYRRGAALEVAETVAAALAGPPDEEPEDGVRSRLTRRENEIAALVADGLSNRAIADTLHLSERTVHGHVQSILRKLDFRSRAQVAVWFVTAVS